jgi:hypothetical protein
MKSTLVDGQLLNLSFKLTVFTNRVVEDWNNLTETVITTKNVKIFENRLDKLWQNHPMMYDHTYNDKQTTTGRTVTGVLVSLIALHRSGPSYPVTFLWLYVGHSRLPLCL